MPHPIGSCPGKLRQVWHGTGSPPVRRGAFGTTLRPAKLQRVPSSGAPRTPVGAAARQSVRMLNTLETTSTARNTALSAEKTAMNRFVESPP